MQLSLHLFMTVFASPGRAKSEPFPFKVSHNRYKIIRALQHECNYSVAVHISVQLIVVHVSTDKVYDNLLFNAVITAYQKKMWNV